MLPGCLSSISCCHNRWWFSWGSLEVFHNFVLMALTYLCVCSSCVVETQTFTGIGFRWIMVLVCHAARDRALLYSQRNSAVLSVWSSLFYLPIFSWLLPRFLSTILSFSTSFQGVCRELYWCLLWFETACSSSLKLTRLGFFSIIIVWTTRIKVDKVP